MIRLFFKFFIRHFQRFWLFNLVNIVGLAIGMATAIIIGSWIHFHLTFNHSLEHADRLFRVIQHLHYDQIDEWVAPTPAPLAEALLQAFPEVSDVCRIHPSEDLIIRANNKSFVENRVIFADSTLFNLFSFEFLNGRKVSIPVRHEIVISETTARKYFGTADPVEKMMQVEEADVIVAGVFRDLPSDTHFDFQVVLPMQLAIELHHEVAVDVWNTYDEIETYIKTAPGANLDNLREKISSFKLNFVENSKDELILQPVKKIHTQTGLNHDLSENIDPTIIIIFSTVALFLLVISISNFFIFSIAQSSRRIREIAIRKIVGSSAGNILTGQILDAFLLVILAFTLSLIVVELLSPLILQLIEVQYNSLLLTKPAMILGLLILIVLTSLGGGFINGFRLLKIQSKSLFRSLNQNKIQGNRLLRSLVILQFTISLAMLIFAFTIYSQLKFIQKKDVGFDKDQLISVRLFDESKMNLFENLEQFLVELRSFAAIQDVTFSCSSPAIINTSAGEAEWDGKNAGESLTVQWNSIFYNYFTTIGAPIVAGRNFSENFENELGGDDYAVYILNEAAVRGMNLKNEDVIGRNFKLYGRTGPIIGVVQDFHYKSLREKIPPMAFDMLPWWYNEIIIRMTPGVPPPLSTIEEVYKKYLSTAPFQYTFITDQYTDIYAAERKLLSYNSILAILMILISALGLSSLSYLIIGSRIKEIGIRKINGATLEDIFILLAGNFGRWILTATIIGIPISLSFINHWLGNYEYKTSLKFSFFLLPILLITGISLLSIIIQVFRASKTNPVEVLRYE